MIAWEIEAKRALANPVPNDFRTGHSPKNHANIGTIHTPERHVITGTVHVHADTTTEARIHQRNGEPIMLPWTL